MVNYSVLVKKVMSCFKVLSYCVCVCACCHTAILNLLPTEYIYPNSNINMARVKMLDTTAQFENSVGAMFFKNTVRP